MNLMEGLQVLDLSNNPGIADDGAKAQNRREVKGLLQAACTLFNSCKVATRDMLERSGKL